MKPLFKRGSVQFCVANYDRDEEAVGLHTLQSDLISLLAELDTLAESCLVRGHARVVIHWHDVKQIQQVLM